MYFRSISDSVEAHLDLFSIFAQKNVLKLYEKKCTHGVLKLASFAGRATLCH